MSSKRTRINNRCFFVRHRNRYHRVEFSRIRYIEARAHYCRIDTGDKVRMVKIGIGDLEELLPQDEFYRIHRSYIVGVAYIEWFEKTKLRAGDKDLPIGVAYYEGLRRILLVVPAETPKVRVASTGKTLVLAAEKSLVLSNA